MENINEITPRTLEIIYQDNDMVVINKPHNLLVHRTKIASEENEFALQILRDQLQCWVSPCHRIDRKTSGLLVFALNEKTDKLVKKQFENKLVNKKYIALVRGFLPDEGFTDRPLAKENGDLQTAVTRYKCLAQIELAIEVSRYPTSRYSLAEINPETGRMHQIRRHFAQLRHYLIGDKTYGECKHNKMFEDRFGLNTMLLHAAELTFVHPTSNETLHLKAGMQKDFLDILHKIGINH